MKPATSENDKLYLKAFLSQPKHKGQDNDFKNYKSSRFLNNEDRRFQTLSLSETLDVIHLNTDEKTGKDRFNQTFAKNRNVCHTFTLPILYIKYLLSIKLTNRRLLRN